MRLRSRRPCFTIEGNFYIYLALFILLLPIRWVAAWAAAAVIHETGHIVAIICCRGRIREIRLRSAGALITTDSLTNRVECICTITGPAASLIGALFSVYFPLFGVFCTIQLLFNLLPLYPMDGGRILNCILLRFYPKANVTIITRFVRIFFSLIVIAFGAVISLCYPLGLLPAVACFLVVLRCVKANIPCKRRRLIVQ